MDVAAAGAGSSSQLESVVRPPPAAGAASSSVAGLALLQDGVSHSLQSLASPEIGELLGRIEHARNTHDPHVLEGLLRTAVAAATANDRPAALAGIAEMVKVHPEHAQHLVRAADAFTPIRGEINHLFERLTFVAKSQAVDTLAAASRVVVPQDVLALNILATGQRFLESGTLINYVRAEELGQLVLAQRPALVEPQEIVDRPVRTPLQRLKTLWRRVPVLVLLVGWLLLGLAGGILALAARYAGGVPMSAAPAEVWAIGFLVLVGFQFFATVRNIRFRTRLVATRDVTVNPQDGRD